MQSAQNNNCGVFPINKNSFVLATTYICNYQSYISLNTIMYSTHTQSVIMLCKAPCIMYVDGKKSLFWDSQREKQKKLERALYNTYVCTVVLDHGYSGTS